MADFYASYPVGGSGGGGGGGITSINGETGPAITLVAGSGIDVTALANFITVSAIGTPNTFAGFDGAGGLYTIPNFNISTTTGGMNPNLTEQPNGNVASYSIHDWVASFDPLQNSPDEIWNIHNVNVQLDINSSGFTQGTSGTAVQTVNLGFNHQGTGDVGRLTFINMNSDLGNGVDPITVEGISFSNGFSNFDANVTIDGTVYGYGFQPNFDAASVGTSSFNIQAFYDASNVGISINGYTGFSSTPVLFDVANNSNFTGVNLNPTITTLTGNASVNGLALSGTIGTMGATSSLQAVNCGPIITTMGANASVSGFSFFPTITTMGASSSFNGVSISGTITTSDGFFTGVNVNTTINGGDASFVGLNVNPQGGATLADPIGLNVAMGSILSSNPQGMVGIQSDSRIQVNSSTQLAAAQGFQIGSRVANLFTVPNGSPVTGTDEIGINIAGDFAAQDDVADGAFGIGFNSVGFIASVAVADTKTVDTVTVFLPAASLPDPGFTTGGAVTEFHMIRTFPPLAQGGTVAITNLYAFKLDSMFGDFAASATNAWGLFIDGTAENYIASSLAIGTTSTKVTNSSVALEIGGVTKAFLNASMTTTERNALTAVNGMQIYNTTTDKLQVYAAGSWVDLH